MYRLLHLADVHLDAPFGGFGRDAAARRTQVLDAFRGLSDVAIEQSVDAVLVSGDLFDSPRPAEKTVIAVRETVRRIVENGIAVVAIPGNHDARALAPGLYLDAFDGAAAFVEPRFGEPVSVDCEAGTLLVYGVAYDAAEEPDPVATFEKARASSPGAAHIVLLHGSIPGAPHWGGGSSLPLSLEALRALEVDYIALGDLHRFRGPEELEEIPACYPGSFAAVDLTESGTHGPVLVQLAPGGKPILRHIGSGVREVGEATSVNVSDCTTDLEVYDAVVRLLPPEQYPSLDLVGEPAFPLDPEAVRLMLEERFGALALRDSSHFFEIQRLEELAKRDTIAGHVARLGLTRIAAASDDQERVSLEQGLRIALRVMEI